MTRARTDRMPAERRRELVCVAAQEFGTAGYDAASLNKIIQHCGMSKSSFYYFVPSKSGLFDLVVRDLLAEVAATFEPPMPVRFEGDQFWPCVAGLFEDLVRIAERDEAFTLLGRIFYKEAPEDAKRSIATTMKAVRTWVEDVLSVGRRSGAVRTDLPADLQNHLIFAVLRVFDEWTLGNYDKLADADLEALARGQFATLRRILEPAP